MTGTAFRARNFVSGVRSGENIDVESMYFHVADRDFLDVGHTGRWHTYGALPSVSPVLSRGLMVRIACPT